MNGLEPHKEPVEVVTPDAVYDSAGILVAERTEDGWREVTGPAYSIPPLWEHHDEVHLWTPEHVEEFAEQFVEDDEWKPEPWQEAILRGWFGFGR